METMLIPDAAREVFYRVSQGEKADREIIGRYKVMLNYFAQNPDRAVEGINEERIRMILSNDIILQTEKSLIKRGYRKILNSPEAIVKRQETRKNVENQDVWRID